MFLVLFCIYFRKYLFEIFTDFWHYLCFIKLNYFYFYWLLSSLVHLRFFNVHKASWVFLKAGFGYSFVVWCAPRNSLLFPFLCEIQVHNFQLFHNISFPKFKFRSFMTIIISFDLHWLLANSLICSQSSSVLCDVCTNTTTTMISLIQWLLFHKKTSVW